MGLLPATKFKYTSGGGSCAIDGVSDSKTLIETVESMKLLGFGIDERRRFFKLLAGVLHLGNVVIKGTPDGEGCTINVS